MKKVLLAIGDEGLSQIFRRALNSHQDDFNVLESEVFHTQYLEEFIDTHQPDILLLHDTYLINEDVSRDERDEIWLGIIQRFRIKYEDTLRIVFFCERSARDTFLSNLVLRTVYDIFNTSSIDRDAMVEQLKDKPRFSNIKRFVHSIEQLPNDALVSDDELEDEENDEVQDTEEKPKPKDSKLKKEKKVVQKQVVQKIVNKNIVKRDFNIQVHNQVEKVVGVPVERKLIMIGSPFSRTGSTFISHLLSRELVKMGISVSYVESPYAYAYSYDRFIGHEKIPLLRSKFYQYTKEIDPKLPSVFDWEMDGINMVVKHPANEPIYSSDEIPFDTYVKILLSQQSTITIVDIGSDWNEEIHRDIYDISSKSYFVIEPDICLMQYIEESQKEPIPFFREVLNDQKSELIGNRFDPSFLKNEVVQQVFKDKLRATIPTFPSTDVFGSQYQGTFLNDNPSQEKAIQECLSPIIADLLPGEFLKKQKQKNGFFKGFFNKKISIDKKEKEMNPQ
jgi:hypothetical protein